MKVLMSPIEMIAWFNLLSTLRPIRFRDVGIVIKVGQIVKVTEEKLAGNRMKVYECQCEFHG